jgi:hypothetical protein
MLLRIVLVCAALAIAAGTAVALLNDDGDGQEVAAAPPEDKPTPQVTVPSQTTPEPEPESPIQRVEIKGRFRKACGDNGLCLEIHKPHDRPRLPPPINGQIVGEVSISYDGEQLMGYDLMSCDVNSDNDAYYPQVGGNTRASDGILRFFGTIPIDTTDLLEIDGMFNIEQLESTSTVSDCDICSMASRRRSCQRTRSQCSVLSAASLRSRRSPANRSTTRYATTARGPRYVESTEVRFRGVALASRWHIHSDLAGCGESRQLRLETSD